MKQFFTLLLISFSAAPCFAQGLYLDFESLNLPLDSFWDGSDQSRAYTEAVGTAPGDSFVLENVYDTAFGGFWSRGYAVSTMRDDTTEGFGNIFSSITATGWNSDAYGVVSAFSTANMTIKGNFDNTPRFLSAYISNSTYAYLSMRDGDNVAKKFGGGSGDDPDYFFIRFYFFPTPTTNAPTDSVDFYLADFRSSDNSEDYILDDWVYLDFNDYPATSYPGYHMKALLFSSDDGPFGISTPAFFCIDDLEIGFPVGVNEVKEDESWSVAVRPYSLDVVSNEVSDFKLYSLSGQLLGQHSGDRQASFPTSELPQGVYILQVENDGVSESKKVWRW